ncbi:MAG TPA: histidine kinase dimerization/phosphoacceptor domain -containing protein [bacterium]|nr:histidine kinase dimerization/phosphoacceptor domain -containing protein [bacterium]
MRHLFKYRTVLVFYILAPVILIGISISAIATFTGANAIRQMVNYLGYETNSRMVSDISRFLRVPILVNEMNADALNSGRIGLDDVDMMESLFTSRVKYTPTVTSVYFGNTKGGLIDAGREGPKGSLYVIVTDGFKNGLFKKFSLRDNGHKESLISAIPGFDARVRPWYRSAVAAGKPTWTEPFLLFTGQDTSISAVHPVYATNRDLLGVLSVDIFLSQLDELLVDLQANLTGYCFITDASGKVLVSPKRDALADILQKRSLESVFAVPGASGKGSVDYSGDLVEHGVRYNVHARSLPDDIGLDWYVFSIYPESEFAKLIGFNYPAIIMGILGSFLLVIAISIVLASIFRKPINNLVIFSQELAKGEWNRTPEASFLYETEILRDSLLAMKQELSDSFSKLNGEIEAKNKANGEIKALLSEKELILKEVHHRMKNNLSVIVSLLRLQEGTTDDANTTATLQEASMRIQSMMLLYDMLFQSENFLEADVVHYIRNIINELSSHYDPDKRVRVRWDTVPITMPSRFLFLLGIIVNEVITNSYKYAFPDRDGEIAVHLAKLDGSAELSLGDNGTGFQGKAEDGARTGFGMRLIDALVEQMDGKLTIEGTSGVMIKITFPLVP